MLYITYECNVKETRKQPEMWCL